MKHITSKLLSLLLTLAMLLSMVPAAYAADEESGEESAEEYAAFSGTTYWTTLQAAINEGPYNIYLAKDVTENFSVPEGKTVNLSLYGHQLHGTVTNNGNLTIDQYKQYYAHPDIGGGDANITNNGTLKLGCDGATGFIVQNNGTLNITSGATYTLSNITNGEAGTVAITGGSFDTEPLSDWLPAGYIAKKQSDGSYKVAAMSDTDAKGLGYVARNTTGTKQYFKTVQDALDAGVFSVYLLSGVNVVENCTMNAAGGITLSGYNSTFTGSLICQEGWSITISSGVTAELSNVNCYELQIGSTASTTGQASTVTLKDGSVCKITVANKNSLTIEGGAYTGAVDVKEGGTLSISGGTFSSNVSAYLAEGYTYDTETGTVKPDTTEPTGVAEVGGTGYATLAEAIRAANTGDTVTLLDNIELTSAQSINKQLTLDLNGKTITSTAANTIKLVAGADLTVKDSAAGGKIANTNSRDAQTIYLSAANTTFTLESGTIESTPNVTSIYSVAIANATKKACTVNINGGNVVTPEAAKDGRAIVAYNGMTLNISGGTITGSLHGVDAYSGSTVNITGGTISARYIDTGLIKEAYGMRIKGTANITINGGEIQGIKMDDTGYNLDVPNVTLVSGNITGSFYSITNGTIVFTVAPTATITFVNDSVSKFLPSTVELVKNEDATYGVTKATAYVAKIADKGQYETLEAAFAEAKDGDTITLLSNCSGNGIVVEESAFPSGLTVDFAGYTYTVSGRLVGSNNSETNGFQLKKGNKITFTNGTITSADTCTGKMSGNRVWTGAAAILLQNYCDLTLDGMTVTGGNATCYTMSNNNGKTVIKDSTIIAGKNTNNVSGPFAFDVCGFANYSGADVTVTGNSRIEGDIEISSDKAGNRDLKFTLESGMVTGSLVASSGAEKVTVTKSSDVTLAAPDGYEWVAGDDSTSTLAKAVAAIGETQYASLQAAFDEAKTGDTVTLLDNITLTEQVNITKALNGLTLDGNGKTITCATTTDPFQSGGSALYFGNAGDKLYCTGIKIKDLTMTGTARFAIFLCGGTTTEFTNVNISGNYYIGINLYGTHGATMTNCNISNSTTGTDKYISAIWSNVSSANPLELVNTKVNTIAINAYTTDNKLEPKIYVKDGSEVGEIHTFDDGSVSGDKKLCVSPTSTGTYTIKEYDETNSEWIDIKDYVAEYNGTKYESLQDAIDAASQKNGGQTEVKLLTDVTITETVVFAKMYSAGSVLLNLSGYTLTGKNCRALQINKGNLYLENGTVTSTGIVNSSSVIRIGSNEDAYSGISPMLYMRNSAKVLAPDSYGVTIFGSKTVSEKLTVAGNASIEATGPSPAISGNGDKAFHVDGKGTQITITGNAVVSATNNYAIYHPDNGTLNIQDNATISGKGGIQMCSGTLKIIGSPKIETLGKADHETGEAGPIYDIAAISAANRSYPGGAPVVTIKDTPTITTVDGENSEVIHAFSWDNTTKTESEWAEAGDCINVSGGTYNKTFNEAYLAEGCTLAAKDGMYTVEQTPVAEYNGTQYTSLAQAFTDARNSEAKATVKLLADVKVTTSLDISSPQGVTLDLNKKTLALDGGAQLYTSKTATIKKGTIKRIDEPTSGNARDFAIYMLDGSSLTLGAGSTLNDTVTLEAKYGIYNVGSTLNVRYALITTEEWSIAVTDSKSNIGKVYIGQTVTNANVRTQITSTNGNCIGTQVRTKPEIMIAGGTLTSNGTNWDAGVIYWASEGTLTITGGTFKASSAEGSTAAAVYQKNGTVKISGTTATLLGNNALVVQAGEGSTGTMVTELSGGKYSTEPDKALVVEGKEVHEKDGLFVVEGEYVVEATLADGTIKSFDSWDKLASVWNETGATIKLLKDTSTAQLVAPNGKLTIDFNGKTLTVTKASSSNAKLEAAIVVQKGGELTLKDSVGNGGLTTTNVYGVEVITGSKLTIESGNYKCFTSAVQVDNGTAYIKGGTFKVEDEDKRYLINCIDEAFKDGTAVMEVTGGTFYGFDPSAKPEGEGTTYVKVGYVVKGNDGVYTVEKSTAEAQIVGTQTFGTLTDMLAQSANGQTVALVNDATVNNWYFAVAPGKTIDLNGNKLTVTGKLYSFGKVIDSTEGEGLLSVTDMAGSQLPKDNGYLPIKDGDGYRLYKYEFAAYGTKASDDKNSVMFAVQLEFTNLEAWDKIKADKNSVQLTYLAEWNGNKSIFSFKHSTLAGIAGKATAEKPTAYFTMTISGFNSLNLDGAEFKMTPQLECAFFTHSVDTQTYTIGG